MIRYWLTPEPDERFDEKVTEINTCYQQAPERHEQGERCESIDEMTGFDKKRFLHFPTFPFETEMPRLDNS